MLASWKGGAAESAIVDFVARVARAGGTDYVPSAERIATFDNDGTLWCEQPVQVQFLFLVDKAKDYGITVVSMKRDWGTVFAE